MEQLDLIEDCLSHYSEDSDVFKELAKEMHGVYSNIDRAIKVMHRKHEIADAEVHKIYKDMHEDRAARLMKEAHMGIHGDRR